MEGVGLAIGVVALASVFKDCIDLFNYIDAGRGFQKDAATHSLKLRRLCCFSGAIEYNF